MPNRRTTHRAPRTVSKAEDPDNASLARVPREIGRNGPAITYKAIGYDSGRTVAMQLVPVASIDEMDRVQFEESARTAQKLCDVLEPLAVRRKGDVDYLRYCARMHEHYVESQRLVADLLRR